MITKKDVIEYFIQLEEKAIKLDAFYGKLFSQVNDIALKEKFLRLKCEEKVHLELVHKLKEIFQQEWTK